MSGEAEGGGSWELWRAWSGRGLYGKSGIKGGDLPQLGAKLLARRTSTKRK
jgi:hypothetical protein